MQGRMAIILASLCAAVFVLVAVSTSSTDDPFIPLELRSQIWSTTDEYLAAQSGVISLYDPIENRVLLLAWRNPHEGIDRKGDFFVRCVDFIDQDGRKIDVDLLVLQTGKPMQVTQAIVHRVDGVERQINLLRSAGPSM